MRILVVAPHPDDETLGTGATMHRLASEGHHITVAVATRGWEPLFPAGQVAEVRKECEAAAAILGVADLRFLDLPVTRLTVMPEHELNAAFGNLIGTVHPELVFLPFPGDRHEDHRQVFDACQVALRPVGSVQTVRRVLCYETVSETHWAAPGVEPHFQPDLFVDISAHLEAKLEALRAYRTQLRLAPDPRSVEAIRALARFRGSVVSMDAAEAFVTLRERWTLDRAVAG